MSENDEKQNRADRLSRHRKDRTQPRDSEQRGQPEQQEQPGKQEQPEQPDKPGQPGQPQNVKEQYQGTYIYVPPALREQMDLVADTLDLNRRQRNGTRVEKIRHFYPLLISLGLERIEEANSEELEQRLTEFDAEN